VAVLPPSALNSDCCPLAAKYTTDARVLHLMGVSGQVRAAVFSEAADALCTAAASAPEAQRILPAGTLPRQLRLTPGRLLRLFERESCTAMRRELAALRREAARGKLDAAFVQAVGKYRQTSNFCVTPLAAAGQEEPAHAVASGVWEELRGLAQRFLTRPEVDAGKPLCHTVPIEELMHYYWLVVFTYDAASALGVAEGDSGKMQLVPHMVEFLSSFDSTSIAALAEVRRDAADDLITRKASMQLENGRLKLRLTADAAAARGTRSETAEETARRTEIVAEAEASFRAALETSKGLASTPAQEGASMETLYHLSGLLEALGALPTRTNCM